MWRKFKWDMFVTSFIPLWISIFAINIWDIVSVFLRQWNQKTNAIDNIHNCLYSARIQWISIVVIAAMVIISIAGINGFIKKLKVSTNNSLGKIVNATKANKLSAEFLLAYILPMIAFNFDEIQNIVLFLIYFAVLAFLCIRNNNIYTNIYLEFKGYKMYTCNIECSVLEGKHLYHDSLIISTIDLTLEEGNNVEYWDFDNYIYITI